MRIVQQTAEILLPTDGTAALKQIEYAGRNCYRSENKITESSAPRFVRSLIQRGHLSPLEFADMTAE